MRSKKLFWKPISCFLVATFLATGSVAESSEKKLLTAARKPVEGPLDVFLGEPFFDMQVVLMREITFASHTWRLLSTGPFWRCATTQSIFVAARMEVGLGVKSSTCRSPIPTAI